MLGSDTRDNKLIAKCLQTADNACYDYIEKGGAVIITIVEERYSRNVYPEVFVSNNNKLKRVEL